MVKQISLKSKNTTKKIAQVMAPFMTRNVVLLLEGPLGSGKTYFTSQLCRCLDVNDTVNSPSYVLINQYYTRSYPIFHIDLYRLTSTEEALQLGVHELSEEGLVIIEWPKIIEHIFSFDNKKNTNCIPTIIKLSFEFDNNFRRVNLNCNKEKIFNQLKTDLNSVG